MKRLKALSIITAMLFTLTACGNDKDDDSKGTTAANTTENIIVSEPTETATVDNTTTEATSGDDQSTSDDTTTQSTNGDFEGDFDVSGPKWNWINWDANGDGTLDQLEFEYHDNGDEAASFIEVTFYDGSSNTTVSGMIDRGYSLTKIYSRETSEGPYLHIYYEQGDYYGTGPAECFLLLKNGQIQIRYIEE